MAIAAGTHRRLPREIVRARVRILLTGMSFGPRSCLLELMLVLMLFLWILTFSLGRTTICSLEQKMRLSQKLTERKFP
jgi:hypothetical protein